MKNSLRFLLGLSLLLISASQAHASGIYIDQMQPVVDDTVGGLAIGGASQQKLAQTVTVGLDGRLVGVFLPIGCDSGRLVIEIRELDAEGKPSDVVLRRREFNAANISPIGPVFRFFPLRVPLLSAGDRFAVVLQNPTGSCAIFSSPVGDSYAGGEGFFEALPNPPGWVPFSDTETRLDLPFITEVSLP